MVKTALQYEVDCLVEKLRFHMPSSTDKKLKLKGEGSVGDTAWWEVNQMVLVSRVNWREAGHCSRGP